ncbi:MAG: DUF2059 domain-containing protein [Xanthobacteraceae bacterium]
MLFPKGCRAVMLVLLALVLPIGAAWAQKPSSPAAPKASTNSVTIAKELIAAKGATKIYEPIIVGVVEQARMVLLRSNPMLSKDLNELGTKLRAEYVPRSSELVDEAAKIYATRFTEQELKDALAFYKTPLGRKLIAEEPVVLDESMRNAESWANRLSEEVIGKFRTEMKKRGHEI